MKRTPLRLVIAGAGIAGLLGLAGAGVASAATECTVNCTSGSVQVGSTLGSNGFPTSFSMSGNAGSTATATATPYSVFSNQPWSLTFTTDASDGVAVPGSGGLIAAYWQAGLANFPIGGTTSITHAGSTHTLPSVNGIASVLIDNGVATAGGQGFADVFSVAIPATQAPATYGAEFAYVLAGS